MTTSSTTLSQDMLDTLLPPDRTDQFFDALYGGAEDGAYDIKLTVRSITDNCVQLAFELHQRPDKCLVCSLTYGLPQVFQRHPLINTAGIAHAVVAALGWDESKTSWTLGRTEEHSSALHSIPLTISLAS